VPPVGLVAFVPTTDEITDQKERDEIKIKALIHAIEHLRKQAAEEEERYWRLMRGSNSRWKRSSRYKLEKQQRSGFRDSLYWLGNEIRKRENERDVLIAKRLEWI
jgi:hypothetical protein